jgi:microcin C transport system permease protein
VKAYFIRRLLLIPPTLIGITLMVFMIMRLAPGGPVERDLQRMMSQGEDKGGSSVGREQEGFAVTPAQLLELEERHGRDKPALRSYLEWLGVLPRDLQRTAAVFEDGAMETEVLLPGTVEEIVVKRDGEGHGVLEVPEGKNGGGAVDGGKADISGWKVRIQTPGAQKKRWERRVKRDLAEDPPYRAVVYRAGFRGLLEGSLGNSEKYGDPVWGMILDRIPISLFFGGLSMILIYGVCLPLGIVKAIKHRTWIDNATSVLVFLGYAIPGYVLGAFLIVYLGARLGWFPIQGFTSENFADLGFWGKIKDLAHHGTLPLICYVIQGFAFMTFMMKNSLMDNLAADYVRTATAKGVPYRTAVFKHAFRNSIIPIATTIGQNITIFVAGSLLIEKIFDINGFGLLQFTAILEKDEYIVLGVLTVSAGLMLLGNVLSDLCVAMVDPRVSFTGKA